MNDLVRVEVDIEGDSRVRNRNRGNLSFHRFRFSQWNLYTQLVSIRPTPQERETCDIPSSLCSYPLRTISHLFQEMRGKDRVEFHASDKRDDECGIEGRTKTTVSVHYPSRRVQG